MNRGTVKGESGSTRDGPLVWGSDDMDRHEMSISVYDAHISVLGN